MIGTIVRHGKTRRDLDRLATHLMRADQNEEVTVRLSGTLAPDLLGALEDAWRIGQGSGLDSTLVHASLSPSTHLTPEELREAADVLLSWFGADDGRPVAFVVHKKKRMGGEGEQHIHVVVSRAGPNGTVRAGFEKIRMETLCRVLELELGEPMTVGRHTRASLKHLRRIGRHDVAGTLTNAAKQLGRKPKAAITSPRRQALKRVRIDDRKVRAFICEHWSKDGSASEFRASLAASGINVAPGKKAGVYVVRLNGHFVASLDRILRVHRSTVASRLEGRQPWPVAARSDLSATQTHGSSPTGRMPPARQKLGPSAEATFLGGRRPEDYRNRTDMWGVGQLHKPDRAPVRRPKR